jgi:hypothetical protein
MRTSIYFLISIVLAYVSNYGYKLTQHAIDTVGSSSSLDEFELGQRIFLIAGTLAAGFFLVAAMRIIDKVTK